MCSKVRTAIGARGRSSRTAGALGAAMLLAALTVAGCATSAPVTVRRDRFNFNEAGAESTKEQILLNIVRLRYGEPMYFVDVGSMLSHYSISASGEYTRYKSDLHVWNNPALRAVYNMRGEPVPGSHTWDVNLNYTDSPTITYTPLTGEEFANRVMSPIPPTTILFLSQSGWGIDRLLECCVQQINNVTNTPIREAEQAEASDAERFERLAVLLRKSQDSGNLRFDVESGAGGGATYIYLPVPQPEFAQEANEIRGLLGLPTEGPLKMRLTPGVVPVRPDDIAIQTRSLLAVMHALAQEVAVPPEHLTKGQAATQPSPAPPEAFSRWVNVKHSLLPQMDPFVQVFYRGHWFYIDQADWTSKRTFSLLTYLLALQSATKEQAGPLLTVPAGDH